jgi:hypothetical protein
MEGMNKEEDSGCMDGVGYEWARRTLAGSTYGVHITAKQACTTYRPEALSSRCRCLGDATASCVSARVSDHAETYRRT